MNIKKSLYQSIILFFCLSFLGASIQYILYRQDIKAVKEQTRYLYNFENERLRKYFSTYSDVLLSYKSELEDDENFEPILFKTIAKKFLRHFKDTLAFNFINHNMTISNVNPDAVNQAALGKNLRKHPDSLIREVFSKGLSRDSISFIPPVNIYQGGRAIIFYVPVDFSSGNYGWINVVILADNVFENYQKGLGIFDFKFNVVDDESNRSFIGDSEFDRQGRGVLSFPSHLYGRKITYYFDFARQFNFHAFQSLKDYSVFLLICLFLSFLFFLYSKNRQELYNQFINVSNESNLLKTLIHDISGPIQAVFLGVQNMHDEKIYDEELMNQIIYNQNITTEVIHTVRSIFSGKFLLDEKVTIDLLAIVEDQVRLFQSNLENTGVTVKIVIEGPTSVLSSIDERTLKNHILRNIISNAIKFSTQNTQITILIKEHSISISNHHSTLSDDLLRDLNKLIPLESSEDNLKKTSLGLGMFIAKIFCHKAGIGFEISQDDQTNLVISTLKF